MPLFLLILVILFLTASVRSETSDGTKPYKLLLDTLKSDFTGPNNFFYWGIALWAIIAVGYFKPLKPVSDAFLALVIISLFFANKGFFYKFMQIMQGTETVQANPISPAKAPGMLADSLQSILYGRKN